MKQVTLYTDGACSGNPGPGGWGAILMFGEHKKELSGGEQNTTNNRMELTAVIKGLQALKEPCIVELYSDSKYVIDALDKGWAVGWRARGWKKADKKPALNPDLWEILLNLCETHTVNLHWVKGHAENPYNNRCDELAVIESKRAGACKEEKKKIKVSCENCKEYRRENCSGFSNTICEDYSPAYCVTKEEKQNWPEYGLASEIRIKESKKDRY